MVIPTTRLGQCVVHHFQPGRRRPPHARERRAGAFPRGEARLTMKPRAAASGPTIPQAQSAIQRRSIVRRFLIAFAGLTLALFLALGARAAETLKPIELLIITGDHGHDWKATTQALQDSL